jgi:hypothetical protein
MFYVYGILIIVESSQTTLLRHLMQNYSKEVRPWNNGTTEVKLDVAIVKLILVVCLYIELYRRPCAF